VNTVGHNNVLGTPDVCKQSVIVALYYLYYVILPVLYLKFIIVFSIFVQILACWFCLQRFRIFAATHRECLPQCQCYRTAFLG